MTDRQTDTQDNYYNPRRGLIIVKTVLPTTCDKREKIIQPVFMDSVTEVAGHLYQAVLIHTPTLNLLVHLCGQYAGLEMIAVRHLQPIAVYVLLLCCSDWDLHVLWRKEEGRSITHTTHDHYTAFFTCQ